MRIVIILLLIGFNISIHAQQSEEPKTYMEKMPAFPEGTEAMYKYIYKTLHYPADALKYKISGQVITKFIVSTEGEIQDIEIVRGIGYGCDEEAKRVVESMNDGHKWTPGLNNGKPVPITYTLPIMFALRSNL